MFSNRSNPPLRQVSMFNTSPISRKCDITVRTCKLLRHIIPLEEIDRNCLQLSYALLFGLIHISLTFSERDVGTALSYRDKNHFGASISRKTNFKSSIWKWQRRHFRKLLEVARFSLRDVTMAKIVRTNKLPSSPPPPPPPALSAIVLSKRPTLSKKTNFFFEFLGTLKNFGENCNFVKDWCSVLKSE